MVKDIDFVLFCLELEKVGREQAHASVLLLGAHRTGGRAREHPCAIQEALFAFRWPPVGVLPTGSPSKACFGARTCLSRG